MQTIAFGSGCFWCSEASFSMLRGVESAESGYAGGHVKNPTYAQVCTGQTGHAEVVRVEFDEKKIGLDNLLEVFFAIHDPTSSNRQGNDVGSQYRSIILYSTPAQKKEIDEFIKKKSGEYDKPIVTEVKKLDVFYQAESDHDEYYAKNPLNPYCMFVISPKIAKIRKEFAKLVKEK